MTEQVRGLRVSTRAARPAAGGPNVVRGGAARLPLPPHVGVTAGVAIGMYAVTIAGVTGLQAATDARLAAERAPALNAVGTLTVGSDRLESQLAVVETELQRTADRYAALSAGIDGYEARLAILSASVSDVAGTAATLPARVSLPAVSGRVAAVPSRPATNATTGASGAP